MRGGHDSQNGPKTRHGRLGEPQARADPGARALKAEPRPDTATTTAAPPESEPLDRFAEAQSRAQGLLGTLTETAYVLPEGLNLGEWMAIGETLQRMERSVMWWLGHWWNYGDRNYGEMASQASKDALKDRTGHAYKTILNAATVADRFQFSRRRENVPFGHHAEAASLTEEDADALLDIVEADGTKRAALRDIIKERKNAISVERALSQPSPTIIPPNVHIEAGDARLMPFYDGTAHLIVTSPPYGVGLEGYRDGEDILAGDWPAFMLAWLTEAHRVVDDHGRLALNVPIDTTAHAVQMAEATA